MSEIEGTTVFTGERSQAGYRLNRLAWSLTDPANRARLQADEAGFLTASGLTAEEADIVHRRDWPAAVAAGASIYLVIKIAGTLGENLLQVGARMRGECLQQFMATRPGLQGH